MKIRNPFKDYLGRWKDDATMTEKNVWTLVAISFGFALGKAGIALTKYIFLLFNFSSVYICLE